MYGAEGASSGLNLPITEACHIDAKGCHVRWMYTHCQKRHYMTPWDENALLI